MDVRLLDLVPKRYLCPYCGQWHDWPSEWPERTLEDGLYEVQCEKLVEIGATHEGALTFEFEEGKLHYKTKRVCGRASFDLDGTIPISEIQEDAKNARATFQVPFKPCDSVSSYICRNCLACDCCNLVALADKSESQELTITLGFEFDPEEYAEYSLTAKLAEVQEREWAVAQKEQELQGQEEALAEKEQELDEWQVSLTEREQRLQELEKASKKAPKVANPKQKREDTTMAEATKKTTLKEQLFEHSPKENIDLMKAWMGKYKPVLQWAVPVASIYAAYRILNAKDSGLTVDNIDEVCEEKLGFGLDCLKNKKQLKELLAFGGLTAGAYGAIKALSTMTGAQELCVEDVEEGMGKLEKESKRFAWIQPKTETMLPIAIGVILVYVMSNQEKPKFVNWTQQKLQALTGDWAIRLNLYKEMAKLFIADKFGIELSSEEEKQKFKTVSILVAIAGILVFLYGKKVLKKRKDAKQPCKEDEDDFEPLPFGDEEESADDKQPPTAMQTFMQQILQNLKKLAPAAFAAIISVLVSKKFIEGMAEEIEPCSTHEEQEGQEEIEAPVPTPEEEEGKVTSHEPAEEGE